MGLFNREISPWFSQSRVCAPDVWILGQNMKFHTREVSWKSLDQVVPYGIDSLQLFVCNGEMITGTF